MIEALRIHFAPAPVSIIFSAFVVGVLCVAVLAWDWIDARRRRLRSEKTMRELAEFERAMKTKDPEL